MNACMLSKFQAFIWAVHTELRKFLRTWLRECCRQVEAEVVSNSRSKLHQTTYKEIFSALYMRKIKVDWTRRERGRAKRILLWNCAVASEAIHFPSATQRHNRSFSAKGDQRAVTTDVSGTVKASQRHYPLVSLGDADRGLPRSVPSRDGDDGAGVIAWPWPGSTPTSPSSEPRRASVAIKLNLHCRQETFLGRHC